MDFKEYVNKLSEMCHRESLEAGWWHDPETGDHLLNERGTVPTKIALIHSEVSEALEGHRKDLMDDKLPTRKMVEVELADAIIRIADLAGALELDLGGAIEGKMEYNRVRADHKAEHRRGPGGKKF